MSTTYITWHVTKSNGYEGRNFLKIIIEFFSEQQIVIQCLTLKT